MNIPDSSLTAIHRLTASPAPRRPETASRRTPPVPADGPTARQEGDTLSLSTDPTGRQARDAAAFRDVQAISFTELFRQAGAEAAAHGQGLATRSPMDLSASSASAPGFSGEGGLLSEDEEVLKRYLLLVKTFLEDPEEALGRFLGESRESLNGTAGGAIGEALRGIFGGGEGWQGAVRLSEAVAGFVSRLRVTLAAREGEAPVEGEGEADPLVLDLGGDGIRTSGVDAGVAFDIQGDGRSRRVSFVSGDDALLTLDRNGNGIVDDGRELFGDQNGAANGFLELARYDENRDGQVDSQDAVYERLRVFQDLNGDGVSQAGELKGLGAAGVAAVGVGFTETDERTDGGDRVAQRAYFLRVDGSKGLAADLLLRYRNDPPKDTRRMDVRG